MLIVRHTRRWYELRLPHLVFVDGLLAGVMEGDELRLDAPAGSYCLRVQAGGRVPIGRSGRSVELALSATQQVEVGKVGDTTVEFHDRERLWNLLFDVDLVLWVVSLVVAMPTVYKVVSDLFFVVWVVRLVVIRKRYYRMVVLP